MSEEQTQAEYENEREHHEAALAERDTADGVREMNELFDKAQSAVRDTTLQIAEIEKLVAEVFQELFGSVQKLTARNLELEAEITALKAEKEAEKMAEEKRRSVPEPGKKYRHYKGRLFRVLMMADAHETGETHVVYEETDHAGNVGTTYVRSLESWNEEAVVRGELVPRFLDVEMAV